jgi:hypothetical protein
MLDRRSVLAPWMLATTTSPLAAPDKQDRVIRLRQLQSIVANTKPKWRFYGILNHLRAISDFTFLSGDVASER